MNGFRTGEVRFKNIPSGVLRQSPDGISTFTYQPGWLTPIACALPNTTSIHTTVGGLHPFFQHLTAEGWLRERQARACALDLDDDFGLLLRYGHDCIGAVSVHDPGAPERSQLSSDLEPVVKVALSAQRTISGVQKKLLVKKTANGFAPAERDGVAHYIAKFNNADVDNLVRNEALTLRLARDLLGAEAVTEATVADVDGFGTALVVKRFDRTDDDQKLRLEDFAQILAIPRRPDNSGKYNASYEDAAEAIKNYSARPEIDLLRFFQLVVANALLGNCDAHLKNFSLLEAKEGLRLAPAYDLVNTLLYHRQAYSTKFALRIDGREHSHEHLDLALFERFGGNIGLNTKTVAAAIEDLKKKAAKVISLLRGRLGQAPERGFIDEYHDIVSSAVLRILP